MKVMLLAISNSQTEAGRPPSKEAITAMHQFNEELEKAGVLVDLGGLKPMSLGKRVTYAAGKVTVTDGPFTEAKEMIAGYTLIQTKTREEALEWTRRFPKPHFDDV